MAAVVPSEALPGYREKGYVHLRGVFGPAEVAAWRAECDRLAASDLVDPFNVRVVVYRGPDGRSTVERLDPLVDVSPLFASLVGDRRLLDPLRAALGGEPLLFKDKLIWKSPGVAGYQMHQDGAWWQAFPYRRIVSALVAIDPSDAQNGGLEVFPGYHDRLLTPEGERRNMTPEEEATLVDPSRGDIPSCAPGDVLVFHSLVPHRSAANRAAHSRRLLYLTYVRADDGDAYKSYYEDLRHHLFARIPPEERARYHFR